MLCIYEVVELIAEEGWSDLGWSEVGWSDVGTIVGLLVVLNVGLMVVDS